MTRLSAYALGASLLAMPALADTPRVVTDIAPVHSLVAMVLGEDAQIDTLLQPGGSPHDLSLRPSQARALTQADLVVWIGPDLSPGLEAPLAQLAGEASVLALMAVEGTEVLTVRAAEDLLAHGHDDHEEHGHDDDHDDHGHDDHGHDDHADHDDHEDHGHDDHDDHGHEDHDDHGHSHAAGSPDPHAWLNPDNAQVWLEAIAKAASAQAPENAATYAENARLGAERIAASTALAAERLAPLKDKPLAVYHDAFQYFEDRFDLTVVGAVSDNDDVKPGAAHMADLRDHLSDVQPLCFLAEPGATEGLIAAATERASIPVAELDQLGRALPQGAGLYPALIEDLAQSISACAGL